MNVEENKSRNLLKKLHFVNISDGKPNTYTFTKALAETMVAEHRGNIPTVIIRPSIGNFLNNFI